MAHKIRLIASSILIALTLIGCKAQKITESNDLMFSNQKELPKELADLIKIRKDGYYRIFKNDTSKVKNYSKEFIFSKIDKSKNYDYIVEAEYWLAFHYREGIPELIKRITNDKFIGLKNYQDLIIMERVNNGDMNIDGHGSMVADDLFKISGRANYLLKELTGENFGDVKMKSTEKELQELQKKWVKWLNNL